MPVITDPRTLHGLVNKLKMTRRDYEETKQEITDLFMPYRGDITTHYGPGTQRKPLYDNWGVMQADRFSNWLNGTLFPSSSDWVKLRNPGAVRFDRDREAVFEVTGLRLMDALANSNFYTAAATDTRDWGVLGNSTLQTKHDDENAPSPDTFGGLIFDPIPWSRMWWQFSHIGRPLISAREVEMPLIDAWNFFDRDDDRRPARWNELYRTHPYEDVCIIHVIQRNHTGVKGTSNKPWSSIWFFEDDPQVIRFGGMDNNPYVSARMMVMDGEQYGRGRGDIARPVMKGVNEITRQEMIALGKEFNPPFMAEEDEIANLDLTPGGHVVVRPPKEVQPGYLRSGTDFQLAELIRENMHKSVTEAFLGDALGEPETQTRSAEAERSRTQRALARLASTGQTLYHEKLTPLIENCIDIMLTKGALPELQEAINEDPELEFVPEFTSPFFTAQKSQSLARVDAFLERRLQRFERTGDPAVFEDLDNDELREVEKFLGDVPARIFKSQEEIEQIRNARGDRESDARIAEILGQRGQQSQTQVQLRPRGGRAAGGLTGGAV